MSFEPKDFFSRQAATQAGVTWRALASTDYRRVAHDQHIDAGVLDNLILRCRALVPFLAGRPFSHHTAASLWGGSVPVSAALHVAVQGQDRTNRTGLKIHRFRYPLDLARRLSFPVTSPEMTFGHMARELDLIDLVGLGDSLVRAGCTSPNSLMRQADRWPGQHRRTLVSAARLVRSGVDSVLETRTRILLIFAGLPEPVCNVVLNRQDDGNVLWRLDMGYPAWKVAIEYDGVWHRDPAQVERDAVRRSALGRLGWEVIVVTSRDLHERPAEVLARVKGAVERAGAKRIDLKDAWRRHFPTPLRAA